MSPEFEKKLNFDSDTFSDIKRDMNFVLQRLLGNMKEKGSTEGSMTLKIEVSFTSEYIPNYNPEIEGESRKIEKPKFKHKVTSAVQIKDEMSGNLDTEMELVFDEVTGEYIMRPIVDTAQRSIFDADFRSAAEDVECMNDESCEDNEQPALTGRKVAALPGPIVEEAEYSEVACKCYECIYLGRNDEDGSFYCNFGDSERYGTAVNEYDGCNVGESKADALQKANC